MTRWDVVLVQGLDSFVKVDLLRYLVVTEGTPIAPVHAAKDIGYGVTDVMKALRDLVALGIVASVWRDGAPRFVLAAPPKARRTIGRLLDSWAGLHRACAGPEEDGPDKEAT